MALEFPKRKVRIYAFCLHRGANNCEDLTYGDGPLSNRRGNVAMAIWLAYQQQLLGMDCQLILGGGVNYPDGLTESMAAKALAQKRVSKDLADGVDLETYDVLMHIIDSAQVRTAGNNTSSELDDVLQHAVSEGVQVMYFVCAPFHGPRAFQTLLMKMKALGITGLEVHLVPSEVDLEGGGIEHCVTAEPPHRGDDKQLLLAPEHRRHELMGKMGALYLQLLRNNPDELKDFASKLNELFRGYQPD